MDALPSLLISVAAACSSLALLLALVLAAPHRRMPLRTSAWVGGVIMLVGLLHTVWMHVGFTRIPAEAAPPWRYGAVLFLQSWGFYALLAGVLQPPEREDRAVLLAGLVSVALALGVPTRWAVPVALTLGTGYAIHLAVLLYRLRVARRWFRVEAPVVLLFAGMGLLIGLAGALIPLWWSWEVFALVYSGGLLLGFLLVTGLLMLVPDLALRTQEAVQVSYSQSSLGKVDVAAAAERLRLAMESEHRYRDENLGLAQLARQVDLSPHQLSELLNARFGVSFSQYLRRHRVAAACRMLIDEPRASVLSVGLSVGFASQSTFYAAFKEELGVAPGEYRRRQAPADRG